MFLISFILFWFFVVGFFFAFLLTLFTIFNSRIQELELKIILPLGILKHSWSHDILGHQSISLKGWWWFPRLFMMNGDV